MKVPQPVSLEGLPASRRVLIWLMLVFANGQGRPGACEERAVKGRPVLPASRLSLCFLYGRGDCLCLEFASVVLPGYVWLCARYCKGASRGSRPASRWRCLRAGLVDAGVVYQRVQRRALVVVQRRNAAGGCGGLAPCEGESLRGVSPSHVAGPGERFLFRIM